MITSEKEYFEVMRDMIRRVQDGYEPPFDADAEELEIFSDCIKLGYIRGRTTYIDRDGHEEELRTLDGKMHPELINHVIPPKGLAFLNSEPLLTDESKDKCRKPSETHSSQNRDDTGKKSLHWTIAGVIATVVIGVLSITTAIVIWRLS